MAITEYEDQIKDLVKKDAHSEFVLDFWQFMSKFLMKKFWKILHYKTKKAKLILIL